MKKLLLILLAVILSISCLSLTGCADVFDGDYQDCTIEDLQAIVNSAEFQQGIHTIVLSNGYEVKNSFTGEAYLGYGYENGKETGEIIGKFALSNGELKAHIFHTTTFFNGNSNLGSGERELWYSNGWVYERISTNFLGQKITNTAKNDGNGWWLGFTFSAEFLYSMIYDEISFASIFQEAITDNTISISVISNEKETKIKFYSKDNFEAIFIFDSQYNLTHQKYTEWDDNHEQSTTTWIPYSGNISFPNNLDSYPNGNVLD